MASDTPYEFKEVCVEDVVSKAMVELESALAGEHEEVLVEKKAAIMEIVRKQVETDANLSRKLAPLVTNEAESAELEAVMSTVLPLDDVQLIKNTFLFETYQVEVYKCSIPGPKSFVKFLREGEEMFPDMALDSSGKVLDASWLQWASIAIEIFMLVLSAVGIKVSFNQRQMAKVTRSVERIIQSSAFKKALIAFKTAWSKGGVWNRARAVFDFLRKSFSAGIFWKIVKTVLSTMSLWDYLKAMAIIAAMIVAAFASGGLALIAKVVLALHSAVTLIQKMANLEVLEKIQV
ncbi:uncharacterized protein LOC123537017 [Mercenaria mercenaria]|uniref:uncharacterized protein LOC123537017 n=1 Tax=Mercenaria mercenaria TaxID=6596 RepID=UPI001E1E18BB|nr:uncharacterized protein LOC123537017 [Mercenaria mercenaria]